VRCFGAAPCRRRRARERAPTTAVGWGGGGADGATADRRAHAGGAALDFFATRLVARGHWWGGGAPAPALSPLARPRHGRSVPAEDGRGAMVLGSSIGGRIVTWVRKAWEKEKEAMVVRYNKGVGVDGLFSGRRRRLVMAHSSKLALDALVPLSSWKNCFDTAVLPKIPHSNCSKRVPNRPLRPRRSRFGTLLELLQCGIFGRTAVVRKFTLHVQSSS